MCTIKSYSVIGKCFKILRKIYVCVCPYTLCRLACHKSPFLALDHISLRGKRIIFFPLKYSDYFCVYSEIMGSRLFCIFWFFCASNFCKRNICCFAAAKSLQSCPTLCDPIDGSPPGSPVPGILQARTLEWVAISFSNAWKWKVKVKSPCRARLLATPWTAAFQAPPSMGFSRQEYWSGVPLPSPICCFKC